MRLGEAVHGGAAAVIGNGRVGRKIPGGLAGIAEMCCLWAGSRNRAYRARTSRNLQEANNTIPHAKAQPRLAYA